MTQELQGKVKLTFAPEGFSVRLGMPLPPAKPPGGKLAASPFEGRLI